MVKREVKFYVRVFPTVERDVVNFKIENNRETMHVRAPQDINKYKPQFIYWEFQTDGIFCNSCQKDVYNVSVRDSVRRAFNGEDFIILAYGPSNTGKTYTMTGLQGQFEQRGIAPRIIFDVYHLVAEFAEVSNVKIYLSFVEFFGKEVRDLLTKEATAVTKRTPALKIKCISENEALRLIFDGESRRKFEKDHASCSTTVITIHIDTIWLSKPYAHFLTKIQLVDTAGVESITSKFRSDPCQISSNMAMCWIDYVIANASHIYTDEDRLVVLRASQLSEYIGPALIKGNIRLLCHVRLTKDDLLPTLNAMKFGSGVKKIPLPELVFAKKPSSLLLIQSLQEENHKLKDEILLNELLKGEFRQSTLSQEELSHIIRVAEEYLQGRITSPSILSVTDNSILLSVLRHIYTRDMAEMKKEIERVEERPLLKRSAVLSTAPSLGIGRSKRALVSSSRVTGSKAFLVSKSRQSMSTKSSVNRSQSYATKKSHSSTPSISLSAEEIEGVIRDNYWQEFFNRYPELDKRLRTMRFNLVSALRDKEEAGKNAIKLRCRLDDAKLRLEDAQWRRKATRGDAISPDGHEIRSDAEKEAALEAENINMEFLEARQQATHTHANYIEILNLFNDLNETARMEFEEYMNKVYTTTLILPEMESEYIAKQPPKSHSAWSIASKSHYFKEEEEDQEEQRTYFEHLQMSHGKNLIAQVHTRHCTKIH